MPPAPPSGRRHARNSVLPNLIPPLLRDLATPRRRRPRGHPEPIRTHGAHDDEDLRPSDTGLAVRCCPARARRGRAVKAGSRGSHPSARTDYNGRIVTRRIRTRSRSPRLPQRPLCHPVAARLPGTRQLLENALRDSVSANARRLAIRSSITVPQNIPDCQRAACRDVRSVDWRRDYIHAHGQAMQPLAIAGCTLVGQVPRISTTTLNALQHLDWPTRISQPWEQQALPSGPPTQRHKQGRISRESN